MELQKAVEAARNNKQSVLVTLRSDGRPQLSNVLHRVTDDGELQVSTTTDRAKYANLTRNPWVALHVNGDDFWGYAVLEGEATATPVAADPHDATVEALVDLYRALAGEHEDWDDYRAAQVREHRVLVRIRPIRAYGALR